MALHQVDESASPYARLAAKLIDSGFAAIPCRPRSKVPGAYRSGEWFYESDWTPFCDRLPTELEIDAWSKWPGAGICVALGFNDVVAVDIDTDDPSIIAAIESALPCASPVQKRGKKGVTHFFRASAAVKSKPFSIDDDRVLDLLCAGKQVVIPETIHPDTDRPYEWMTEHTLEHVSADRLPMLPDDIAERFARALGPFGYEPEVERAHGERTASGGGTGRKINDAALADLGAWVPHLGIGAKRSGASWRGNARRNGDSFALSFHRKGIKDFVTDERYTPIDVTMKVLEMDFGDAVDWLREKLGLEEPEPIKFAFRKPGEDEPVAKPEAAAHPTDDPVTAMARAYIRDRIANGGEHRPFTDENDPREAALRKVYRENLRKITIDTILLLGDKFSKGKSQPFPVWALGPMLEGATNALVESAQCQPSLAASSLFAHAAGAVQALVDVRTVRGKLLTTIALIAIAESSEGKSLVWGVAAAPFHEFDKWLEEEHARIEVDYKVKLVFWKKEYDAAASATVKPDEVKAAIEKLAEIERRKPKKPNFPSVTFPGGGTLEGLINSFRTQVPSSISSTAEGAQFFRGAAFGDKNAASSASMAIDLIDTGGGGRDLMGDGSADKGRIRLRDVRFSQITAVQPAVIAPFLADLEQAGQGYHARYLKVAPEPIAHEREFDSLSVTRIDRDPRVLAYNEVMRLMLHSSRFGHCAHPLEARGVEPIELTLSKDAMILHDGFARDMARLAGPGKRYSAPSVTEAAKKTAERAIRIAGVLYAVDAFAAPLPERDADDGHGGALLPIGETDLRLQSCEIGSGVMNRAIVLAQWFLEEERRYYLALTQFPESRAERIFLDWLRHILEKNDGWKPPEGKVKVDHGVITGWVFTKDDRKRVPREIRAEPGKSAKDRDAAWISMFEAMSSATPPRCHLLGGRGERGLKVLIPRAAVYPE